MDPNSPEKPNRPDTPTADVVEEFLRGIREIDERQKEIGTLDPDIAREQAKEFSLLEDQIMSAAGQFPVDKREIIPGIFKGTKGGMENGSLDIAAASAEIPITASVMVVALSTIEKRDDLKSRLSKLGITSKYELELWMQPSAELANEPYFASYYFDEFGNYLKVRSFSAGVVELDLPKFRESSTRNLYISEMTPGDFELVGFTLQFLRDKLAKASDKEKEV